MLLPEKKTRDWLVFQHRLFRHGLGVISLVVGQLATLGCSSTQVEEKASKPAQVIARDPSNGRARPVDLAGSAREASSTEQRQASRLTFARASLSVGVPASFGLVMKPSLGPWHHADSSHTQDQLWVFHEPARRTVTLVECESEARLSLQLLRHDLEATNERAWEPVPGYAGRLRVVLLDDGSTLIEGYAVGLSRCLGAAFRVQGGQDYAQRVQRVVLSVFAEFNLMERSVDAAAPQL